MSLSTWLFVQWDVTSLGGGLSLTYQVVALRLKGVRAADIQPLIVYDLEHSDVV